MPEKTDKNLAYAFAAESKASVRNATFAKKAEAEGNDLFDPRPDGKGVMPASYARLVALCSEYGIAASREVFGQELSDGDQPLTRFTANEDV